MHRLKIINFEFHKKLTLIKVDKGYKNSNYTQIKISEKKSFLFNTNLMKVQYIKDNCKY